MCGLQSYRCEVCGSGLVVFVSLSCVMGSCSAHGLRMTSQDSTYTSNWTYLSICASPHVSENRETSCHCEGPWLPPPSFTLC